MSRFIAWIRDFFWDDEEELYGVDDCHDNFLPECVTRVVFDDDFIQLERTRNEKRD